MRRTARAVVIKDNDILLMYRNKFGNEYYTLPGGEVELGEELLQTLYREIAEETSIKIENPQLLYIEHAGSMYGDQYIYLCEFVSGEVRLDPNSEEVMLEKIAHNIHRPLWMKLDELNGLRFLTNELKEKLVYHIKNGWPVQTEEFTSTRNV